MISGQVWVSVFSLEAHFLIFTDYLISFFGLWQVQNLFKILSISHSQEGSNGFHQDGWLDFGQFWKFGMVTFLSMVFQVLQGFNKEGGGEIPSIFLSIGQEGGGFKGDNFFQKLRQDPPSPSSSGNHVSC